MKALFVTTMLLAACSPVSSAPTSIPTASATQSPIATASPTAAVSPATPAPTATVAAGLTRYTNTELGYTVDLPAGWRRGACSEGIVTTAPLAASEIFMGVPEAEEIVRGGSRFARVRVADAAGLTPSAWLERNTSEPDGKFEPVTVGGRSGTRGFIGASGATYAVAFAERGWIYAIERTYYGSADPELEGILTTLRILGDATVGRSPIATPTPRTIESVVDALADGFARKDVAAIADTMTPCVTVGAVPGDPDMRNRAAYTIPLQAEFAAGTSVRVQARPIENDQYAGRFVTSTWSKPGEPDKRVDFLLRAQGDRWSVVAVRPRS